jgi:AmmeMemoRadiSam system protein A
MTHEQDGERLVSLARDAIVHELGGPEPMRPSGAWFAQQAATFVTVTRRGRLHGCIGTIAARRPLAADVESNAVAAAFMDPRSQPFRAEWLPEMGVEVTLLSPLERLRFADEADAVRRIVPGVDGLVLRHGSHRGTFLPQVWESLPTVGEFLAELKVKAGLPPTFWAEGVEIDRFHVQKWGDRHAARAAERARPDASPRTVS